MLDRQKDYTFPVFRHKTHENSVTKNCFYLFPMASQNEIVMINLLSIT